MYFRILCFKTVHFSMEHNLAQKEWTINFFFTYTCMYTLGLKGNTAKDKAVIRFWKGHCDQHAAGRLEAAGCGGAAYTGCRRWHVRRLPSGITKDSSKSANNSRFCRILGKNECFLMEVVSNLKLCMRPIAFGVSSWHESNWFSWYLIKSIDVVILLAGLLYIL